MQYGRYAPGARDVHSTAQRSAFRTAHSADLDRARYRPRVLGWFSTSFGPWLVILELFKHPLKMPFVGAQLVPDPPSPSRYDDVIMTGILRQLAQLASLSTPAAWDSDPPPNSSQRKAKLWYDWAEACLRAIPSMSTDDGKGLWKRLRYRLCHWLRLKLHVLEYAANHLGVLAVDISDHIVRRNISRNTANLGNGHAPRVAGADSAVFTVFD